MLQQFAGELCDAQEPMVQEIVNKRELLQSLTRGIADAAQQLRGDFDDDWWRDGGKPPG